MQSAFAPEDWQRLLGVKRQWDPDNVFRVNHNIPAISQREGALRT